MAVEELDAGFFGCTGSRATKAEPYGDDEPLFSQSTVPDFNSQAEVLVHEKVATMHAENLKDPKNIQKAQSYDAIARVQDTRCQPTWRTNSR
ncbi:hypothetical protein H2201_005120 [Coniosporium apollinis]|uniref:Uncharacterized protein n=1 Tax=Coniosporium apollinis TaxID=61459 RepID=A0ABQ9NTU8_9PEZI|nr:hypothetical protein H2201_005120 [Coniosporium apollinis]